MSVKQFAKFECNSCKRTLEVPSDEIFQKLDNQLPLEWFVLIAAIAGPSTEQGKEPVVRGMSGSSAQHACSLVCLRRLAEGLPELLMFTP